jgi:hypothetical protein
MANHTNLMVFFDPAIMRLLETSSEVAGISPLANIKLSPRKRKYTRFSVFIYQIKQVYVKENLVSSFFFIVFLSCRLITFARWVTHKVSASLLSGFRSTAWPLNL